MFTLCYHSLCLLLLLPLVCSQLLRWVHSPDYPLAYPNHLSMNWSECAPVGLSVSLTLIHLDLENSTLCEHDALMIFIDRHLNMSLCGSMSFKELQSSVNPHLRSTSGGCLSIQFRSDVSLPQVHAGFNALYQTRDVDECASQNHQCSHFCYNFIGGFRCSCPHGYLLKPDNHTCDAIVCEEPKPFRNGHVQFIKGSNNEYLSVFKYRCNEPFYTSNEIQNGSYTCGADQQWRENGTSIIPSCLPVCGHHKLHGIGRILGGKKARPGTFPWQVLLRPSGHKAGAFIIGEKWIMTTAHNQLSPENVKAYVGHNKVKEKEKFIALNISSIYVHPHYNNTDDTNYDNDIALIKLNTPITFSDTVRPLCLPPEGAEMEVKSGWVSGFGLTEFHMDSAELHYVELPIVANETCRNSFAKEREKESWISHLTDNMFCAGFKEGGKDSCKEDNGSAFVVKKDDVHWAKGIVSWGLDCGRAGMYGVYTRVSRYLDWINKVMSENYSNNLQVEWLSQSPSETESISLTMAEPALSCPSSSSTPLNTLTNRVSHFALQTPSDVTGICSLLSLLFVYLMPFLLLHAQTALKLLFTCFTLLFNTALMDWSLKLIWILAIYMNIQSFAFQPVMYGEVQSPHYPEHSPSPLHEHWDLEVPKGYQIQLNFSYINIKPSQDCRNDFLKIVHNGTVEKFCGERNSGNGSHLGIRSISIPTSNVRLSLQTSEVDKGPYPPVGFSAFYHAEDIDECLENRIDLHCSHICLNTMGSYLCACPHGFRLKSDQHTCIEVQCESPNNINGRITPALPTYYYNNVTTVHCDEGYRIITKDGEVSMYKFTCQINGQWSLPLPQCHIIHCGDLPVLLNGKVFYISGAHNQYRSVIKLHCNELYALPATQNATFTCDADKKWKDDRNKVMPVLPKCLPVCGRPSAALTRRKRVLGGQLAPQRAFPWHVFMHQPVRGGGAIIAEQWILTAANNLMSNNQPVSPDKVKLHIGGNDALQLSSMPPLQIESVHIHPLYNNSDFTNFDHDLALIKLKNTIQYNADVMPLCLPSVEDEYTPSLTGWVSGFGQTARSKISRFLRYTSLPLVDKERCQKFIDNLRIPVPLTDNMFCAGVPKGGKDACGGDAGGAFVLKKNGVFWAAGIVSWGYECGKPGRYGVYTRVAQYVDWINKTMSEN
ncbi:complement C1s subcomponent-like [Colossoma macropomum]|uniref:complement C1s subcomponent-like n=1 Tax=Colossoma macropomum TaxID=42526 RepID=UPI0018654AF8|nr:complement C1s subcomponent-like [Colossoma macropomum]